MLALCRTAAALLTTAALALSPSAAASPGHRDPGWRGAWAASPQAPTDRYAPNWSQRGFDDHTLRQIVRVTAGGDRVRIELTNRYGTAPLRIAGATLARAARGGAVVPGSSRHLRFGGEESVTVPAGGTLHSDAVRFPVTPFESLTVTLRPAGPTGPATFHPFAAATTYRAPGDHRADESGAPFGETGRSWYYLSGVEVSGGRDAGRRDGVVALGDSLTDGAGSTPDADNRYPDELAELLAGAGRPRAVLNHGIGGNQLLSDTSWAGEKGLTRLRKDVLTEPGVRTVVVLEGINDIGAGKDVSAERLIDGYRALIGEARDRGLRVVGATLLPVGGSRYGTPANEAVRDAVNHWIRTSGAYDAVADFDRAVADPADPDRILPAYDSGDGLHPNDAGYRAMAEAVDPDLL